MPEEYDPFDPLEEASQSQSEFLLRRQIRNLFDSYNGDWDVIIELVQNAVDALEEKYSDLDEGVPRLEIYINEQTDTLRISDNGGGIANSDAKKILAPNFSKKAFQANSRRNARRLRGHKGVGLTFIAYSNNHLKYCSRTSENSFSGEISGARTWVLEEDSNAESPKVTYVDFQPSFLEGEDTGSSFEVHLDSSKLSNRRLTRDGWVHVLRSLTAIGFVDLLETPSWVNRTEIQFTLINSDGQRVQADDDSIPLEFRYLFPHEIVQQSTDLQGILERYSDVTSVPDHERNRYWGLYKVWNQEDVSDLITDTNCELFADQHNAKAYGFFAHSRDNLNSGLASTRRKFWSPGIQVATENMPTGKMFDVELTYAAGNKDRIIIVIDLENVRPDYGRKDFHEDVTQFSQHIARKMVRSFVGNRELLRAQQVAHGGVRTQQQFNAEQEVERAREREDLDYNSLLKKRPQNEQEVIALFCSLAAQRDIRGYEIISLSGVNQYDGVMKYLLHQNTENTYSNDSRLGVLQENFPEGDPIQALPKNVEFKFSLSDLIRQFDPSDPSSKGFEDIQWVIAWDRGDDEAYDSTSYVLEEVCAPSGVAGREFYGVTHKLHGSTSHKIHVLLLSRVIQILREER